ncbi:MAG: NAD+ synthase [Legionella sp.]|nr:MAG: NAD+ synthase [Legionella sp.]
MTQSLTILMAQINPIVGAIESNTDKIIQIITTHQKTHDLIIFPELALCGYPPEDLLLRRDMLDRIDQALKRITAATQNCTIVLGHPQIVNDLCYNTASILYQSKITAQYHKQQLPNYGVFDEKRYFTPGQQKPCILTLNNYRIGICICEDVWQGDTVPNLVQTPIDLMLVLNASPFEHNKLQQREKVIRQKASGIIVVYVNMVGGQDELVFDGQSMVIDQEGNVVARASAFTEALETVHLTEHLIQGKLTPLLTPTALIYQALVCGLRDYVKKNNIPGVLLGLSGGIDSALTLAIAVDAIGADNVMAVLLPSRYSADMSAQDAQTQSATMKVLTKYLPIDPAFQTILTTLEPCMPQSALGITAENIQARIRGILLMALSNQTGWMVVSTSNKSETAVGYTTLYGDMCGGFAVLKDVLKTKVYELAYYRNQHAEVIPERVLTRAPSAELAPNQTDQDSLPAYEVLDAIIVGYMEHGLSCEQLVALGHPIEAVQQTLRLIKRNEYKRQQAPPGPKISSRAFGRDWRYPITQQFKADESITQ